jgi:serine/threonine-protein kinase
VPFTGESPVEIAMKHLSDTPRPPSMLRPEIPPDLDMVVLRALAKNPEDRFQTAEEMDAELERVAAGAGVTAETADAATAVLSGATLSNAPTAIVPPRRPPPRATSSYRYADPPPRRRSFWPWLLAILLVALALVAGFYAFGQIQDSLSSESSVSVPYVVGIREDNAVNLLNEKGLDAAVHRKPNDTVKEGQVYDQRPEAGVRLDKSSAVDIYVSTGPAKVKVPDVMGKSSDDAVAALTAAKLKFKVLNVFSKEDADTVVAQSPVGGKVVNQGSIVHINVSKGLQPIAIPNVVGQLYDSAAGSLQGAGFAVARRDVDSSQPKDTVIDQQPKGGGSAARGSTVTLYVSKGPKEATIPDVTSQDEASAQQTLEQSGFSVDVQEQDTTDPSQDGIVLDQDPVGGTKAKPGTTVTITVGKLVATP